ncbi:amidohydrolase family protein [Streptomyces violascens]|uniref:Amidohydrolase n=1 Tax=Streptomyces violascens TaxID=67381 RepID=A0ABQ3QII6_9ACTN|nr:amidohydrolase family protein [Streptomyces violascens]GGU02469.1 amidohydrolase [Streptomyces violascens]GHI37070.1 amidohydrolase [Streptomyces violascens]
MSAGFVDAHHHVWDLGVRDQDWITGPQLSPLRRNFTLDDLRPEASSAGVTSTVVVQTVTVAEETPELLSLADGSDLVAGVVGWTDLTSPGVADELARLRGLPGGGRLVGIRHQVQGERNPGWLLRADVRRGLGAVASAGLAYDLVVRADQLSDCARVAALHPELTFVLDHLGKPPIASGALEPWASALRALAALPNTVCKLSGMVTEADWAAWTVADLRPYAETVLDAFGAGRVLWGSDWPVCVLASSYGGVVGVARGVVAGLSAGEREAVFGGTARGVYGLPPAA